MKRIIRVALVSALLAGPVGLMTTTAQAQQTKAYDYDLLTLLGDAIAKIRDSYVEPVDDAKLIEAAVNGMLKSLDPHSAFLPPEQVKQMQVSIKGEFGGLGIEVTMEDGYVKVVTPIDDTPAARAGVQPNDLITHIDGEAVLGLSLTEAVKKMRGAVGTDILLMVNRSGVAEPFEITITRAVIKVQSVRARAEGNVAYIRISSFSEQTESGLRSSMRKLKEELGDNIEGVILDLRNNPGGLLDQAIAVSDAFLDRGEIVSTRARDVSAIERYNAKPGDLASGLPVIVLINGGSASASEIVAGALQDHKRAILMGTKSFGKGSVQSIMQLGGGNQLKLTTARYYTPSGNSIQAKGIVPDIDVPQARLELLETSQRSEADLRNRLDNDTDANSSEGDTVAEPEQRTDYQLQRALDAIHTITIARASLK
ncbi:S41 family peptidase [Minwuia sp. IMCC3077]|uniref:S41 family peptidase n=1 Tax=unclassified Minwuia TaxID=2618799 RepID=UPI0032AF8EF9